MGKLALSVAIGDYDRTQPLIDGKVPTRYRQGLGRIDRIASP